MPVSLSDGVFAVAITLLVFNLQVPHLPTGAISVAALGSALFAQWTSYLTFITSFATILIMWVSHHGIFKMVYRANTPFLFANGLLLLLVTVVPFPTSLVGSPASTSPTASCDTPPGEEADAQLSAGISGLPAGNPAGLLESLCEPG